ncbi:MULTISPECIES: DUF3156 family protein [unclassified Pseudomonas]|uniref:DUF3156 family protein n=1 Tax=unclassified Pseudomonas TaxID=196821 RepID=UPI0024498697|nr:MULTISPECIES: DUF3156 family protein [unclassified Pseudomonas]MDH0301963.1 DUF3156 family protein [Pseudomonas sp. GD04091]MDH1985714.1 DUF3156 family protein [Pseudomonas sp. GD03689]
MSASWLERLTGPRAPAGYRPGATLARLRRNLGLSDLQAAAAFTYREDGPCIEVRERTESHLLMHLVMCEFILRVPACGQGALRAEVHHTGALRRTGVACRLRGGDQALFETLQARLAAVHAILMPLDFKRLSIECRDGQWQVTLEHMGASEVVNRMPAWRRYIPLAAEQRCHLWLAFDALARTLREL